MEKSDESELLNPAQPRHCPYCHSAAGRWQDIEHSISHWPHILIVKTVGWYCRSCRQTSFDEDVANFFERMANKLRSGDIDGLTSLGGDYFSIIYKPRANHERRTTTP